MSNQLIYKSLTIFTFLLATFSIFCEESDGEITTTQNTQSLNLHVPSPAWQDQVIYFIMIDRFNDGDPNNNDQGKGEYDPNDHRKFSGGDLQGIIDKIDYIKNLGATAVWITPPVANQWWDPTIKYGGYHGYWAEHFKEIDAHFGTLETYKQLSHVLHQNGMYLIQDIVANHTGNFFDYQGSYNPDNPVENFTPNLHTVPNTRPSQFPFNLNDINDPSHREANIYRWTPTILHFSDDFQRLNYQLSGLDDLNTANPRVREALRESYGYWIKEAGVDGYRIDTVIYVEHDYWHDFMHSTDPEAPGMNLAAKTTGREDFLTFGEAFIGADPLDNTGDVQVASYLGTDEKPELKAVLNFPLYFTIDRVFSQGQPTSHLGFRLRTASDSSIYKNPFIIPNFIDNHDTQRFISTANSVALQQALMLLMTIPGIPVIYQGTEKLFSQQRASLFANGWGSGGKDHFSETSEMYRFVKNLIEIRTGNKVFSRGNLAILQDSPVGPGVLAYKREYRDQTAVIIFNTADQKILMSNLKTGLPPGTTLNLLAGLDFQEDLVVGRSGNITHELPERSAAVFLSTNETIAVESKVLTIDFSTDISGQVFTDDFTVSGTVSGGSESLALVIDGKLSQAIPFQANNAGNWQVTVPQSRFPFGRTDHSLVVYAPEKSAVSETQNFTTDVSIQGITVSVQDATGDDSGPNDRYRKPRDFTFGKQMDIEAVEATAFGGNLRITLTMGEISTYWNPPNGFDHVVFHVFIDIPAKAGATVLPKLNANAPDDFQWNYMFYSGGWNSVLYSSNAATNDNFGTIATPVPKISVSTDERKITFLFSPDALGNPNSLEGSKIYITTWDGGGSEGFHRPLNIEGGAFEFGGGDGAVDPLILDETSVITISEQ